MGLVRNLRKKWNNWVARTLAELCSAYIKQLAKQTSRKRNNSLPITSLQNNLTTEHRSTTIVTYSQDTSEKIIMKLDQSDEVVSQVREWAIDRLDAAESIGAKAAIYEEFEDWIELEDKDQIEYMALEDIDVKEN